MSSELDQKSDLSRRLSIAIATPLVLLVVLGFVLGRQILKMSEDSRSVDHSDQVLSVANDTLRQAIDQETGVRGFLLTQDRAFLEPFLRASPRDGFARVHQLTSDNPGQQERFDQARDRYDSWYREMATIVETSDIEGGKRADALRDRKVHMDSLRDAMREAINVEEGLRREHVADSIASTSSTRIQFVAFIGASGLLLAFFSRRQLTAIATTFGATLEAETRSREATEREAWIRAGQSKLVEALQGELTLERLGTECLAFLAKYTKADIGVFFTRSGGDWKRTSGYALDGRAAGPERFADGEGIIGRAAKEGDVLELRDMPPDFLKIRSGSGEAAPAHVIVVPGRIEGTTNSVIELGFAGTADARVRDLLERVGESVGVAVRSCEYKQQLRELLEQTQRQAEELQTQQEELRVANEELDAQTAVLRTSQKQLETQQAELEQSNENLVQQRELLERQNLSLAASQEQIATKAREVERASQFKSDFLSNMSHELRTPLNSSLILASLLASNKDGNLTAEQIQFAETIHAAGNDLLTLINDILDLSKIESGKMDVHAETVTVARIGDTLRRTFGPLANEKGLRFDVSTAAGTPQTLATDPVRLEQILKNLVSNALKFTERGEVIVAISTHDDRIDFAVRDTGIGIGEEQRTIIFEAFRQADGTTHRKYGGTGLGLSISRELARLLGGDVGVMSEPGKGSTFTLTLPLTYAGPVAAPVAAPVAPPPTKLAPPRVEAPPSVDEEEQVLSPGARIILVVEDDDSFARILADVAKEAGFECILATTAQRGFQLATKHVPTGIVLDVKLPDHTGLSLLDRLKRDPVTRHIPVHMISSSDYAETALAMGAVAYLVKPVERDQLLDVFKTLESRSTHRVQHVLVVEDDPTLRESVATLLGRDDSVEIRTAGTVADALALLKKHTFDCIVTDLSFPEQSGFDLLETIAGAPSSVPPVIVYTGRSLTTEEEQRLRKYSRSIIVKGARSPERLLDEVTLFLHQVESELPAAQQRLLKQARNREAVFENRTVLVVEDDVRNVFALTSALEPKGARVAIARNGKEALAALDKEPHVDVVLMDVMMPEMDGLEATRRIRKDARFARLPIIALTAKAMRDDQEKCLAAGANDYLAKPLDVEMLLSLLRVWMPKT